MSKANKEKKGSIKYFFTRLAGKIKSKGLFFKIILANIVIISVAVTIIGSIMITTFTDINFKKEVLLGEEALGKIQNYTESKFYLSKELSNNIHSLDHIGERFSNIADNPEYAYDNSLLSFINSFLASINNVDSDISEFILVTTGNNVYSSPAKSGRNVSPSFDYFEYPSVKKLIASKLNSMVIYDEKPSYISKNNVAVISFMGKIFDPIRLPQQNVTGIYIMNVPIAAFDKQINEFRRVLKGDVIITSPDSNIIYATNPEFIGQNYDDMLATYNTPSKLIVRNVKVGNLGFEVINIVTEDVLYYEINQIRMQMVVVIIFSAVIIAILVYFLLRIYKRRILYIANQMQNISGDLNVRLPVQSTDEIGMLSSSFNKMCEALDDYIKLTYAAETKQRVAELNALQAQINPHFLFNTIESIRMKAVEDGNRDLGEMLFLLGNMFRRSIRLNEKIVFLEDEIDYISSYLKLQRFRFNDRIEINIDIPETLLDYGVPKLILQPIVENAIIHGITSTGATGVINITAYEEGSDLLIITKDNGVGMSPLQLEKIRKNTYNKEEKTSEIYSIGLRNVHERLQLLFGKEYGLTVNSEQSVGTTITLRIPCFKKEEMQKIV